MLGGFIGTRGAGFGGRLIGRPDGRSLRRRRGLVGVLLGDRQVETVEPEDVLVLWPELGVLVIEREAAEEPVRVQIRLRNGEIITRDPSRIVDLRSVTKLVGKERSTEGETGT